MKYVIIFLMLFIITSAQMLYNNETGWNKGYLEGKLAGSKKDKLDWTAGSCGAGLLAGCLGSGIVWAVAGGDIPEYVPEGTTEYKMGYVEGYKEATKSKKRGAALLGGAVGFVINTAAIVLIVVLGE